MKRLLLLAFLPYLAISQNFKGRVISSKTEQPVSDVNISFSNIQTLTDKDGQFTVNPSKSFNEQEIIQFSHIGYEIQKISFKELKKLNFKVELIEETETLPEITIQANGKLNLKTKIGFTTLSPLKNAVYSFGSFLKEGKIYVVGGDKSYDFDAFERAKDKTISPEGAVFMKSYYDELRRQEINQSYSGDFAIYDIKSNSWQNSEIKFKKRAYHNLHFYDNTMYVVGGKRISLNAKFEFLENQIEVFDMDKNSITIDQTNPHQAINFASFSYKDNIIIMGGSIKTTLKGKKTFTNKVHFFNITSGLWYELVDMPTPKEATGAVVGDKIYLIGINNDKTATEIESLNLLDEKWQKEGEFFSELESPAITSDNNTIYIFENRRIYLYNVDTKLLKEYIIDLESAGSAIHFFDNKLYIIGGYSHNSFSKTPITSTYSISVDEFDTTKPNRTKILSAASLPKTNQ